VSEAVERFAAILDSADLQHELHESALVTRRRFAPEHFVEQVRALAARFVDRTRSGGTFKAQELIA
jgi:hypothetical protein